jgi:hypothetical protein
VLLLAAFASNARAQTTQPASPQQAWQQAAERLTEAVRGKDLKALTDLLDRGPVVRTFASPALVPPERLLGATSDARLLGVHAYVKIPSTLASDLAEDFKVAELPEAMRRDFEFGDADAERNANETAARWVGQTFGSLGDMPVAVIVLWREEGANSFEHTAAKRPVFILVRGERVEEKYIIRQIIYGDPLERSR